MAKNSVALLTVKRLRELLDYDPLTGVMRWRVDRGRARAGCSPGMSKANGGYLRVSIDGTLHLAHRLAWLHANGVWPSKQIDHVDGDRANNALDNLRDATQSVNSQNLRRAHKDNESGYLGAHANGRGWVSVIRVNGKRVHLGCFNDPRDAHAAYIEAKRKFHEGCTI